MLSILLLITACALYKALKCQQVKMILTAKPQRIRGGHGTSHRLVQKAKELNLNWQVDVETLGDGNCFYRGVVQQCQRQEVWTSLKPSCRNLTHLQLRANVCNLVQNEYNCVINNQPETCEGGRFFITNFIQNNFSSGINDLQQIGIHSMQDMITYQAEGVTKHQNKAWADTLFIQATAVYLGIPIHVMSMNSKREHPFVQILPSFCQRNNTTTCAILLGNENNQHFQSFLPKTLPNPTWQIEIGKSPTNNNLTPELELPAKAKEYCTICCKAVLSLVNHQHTIQPNHLQLTTTCKGCPLKTYTDLHRHFDSKKGKTCQKFYLLSELKTIQNVHKKQISNPYPLHRILLRCRRDSFAILRILYSFSAIRRQNSF